MPTKLQELTIGDVITLSRQVGEPVTPPEPSWPQVESKLKRLFPVASLISLSAIYRFIENPLRPEEIANLTSDPADSTNSLPPRFRQVPPAEAQFLNRILNAPPDLRQIDLATNSINRASAKRLTDFQAKNEPGSLAYALQLSDDDVDYLLTPNLIDETQTVIPPLIRNLWSLTESDNNSPQARSELINAAWADVQTKIATRVVEKYDLQKSLLEQRRQAEIQTQSADKKRRDLLAGAFDTLFPEEKPSDPALVYEQRRSFAVIKHLFDFLHAQQTVDSFDSGSISILDSLLAEHFPEAHTDCQKIVSENGLNGPDAYHLLSQSLLASVWEPGFLLQAGTGAFLNELEETLWLEINDLSTSLEDPSDFWPALRQVRDLTGAQIEQMDPPPAGITPLEQSMQQLFSGTNPHTIEISRLETGYNGAIHFMEKVLEHLNTKLLVGLLRVQTSGSGSDSIIRYRQAVQDLYQSLREPINNSPLGRPQFLVGELPAPEAIPQLLISQISNSGLKVTASDIARQAADSLFFRPNQKMRRLGA